MSIAVEHAQFDDFVVGEVIVSPGRTVTESDVAVFAGLSADYHEIHTDEEYAKAGPHGTRIAHGLLGLAFQSGLAFRNARPIDIIAFAGIENWRFVLPIRIGDTLHTEVTVQSKRPSKSRPERGIVVFDRRLLNQNGELVQEGRTTMIVGRRV